MRTVTLDNLHGPHQIRSEVFRAEPTGPWRRDSTYRFRVSFLTVCPTVCGRVPQRNTTNRTYVCPCMYTFYWSGTGMYPRGELVSCWCSSSSSPKAWDPGQLMFQFTSKGRKKPMCLFKGSQAGRIPPYTQEGQALCSISPSTARMRPTHIREGNLLSSVSWLKC